MDEKYMIAEYVGENCICTGFSIVLIVQKVCRICEPLKTNILKKDWEFTGVIAPTLVQFFILFWWVKNECLWHSVKTPNRDMDNKWVAEKSFLKLLSTKN